MQIHLLHRPDTVEKDGGEDKKEDRKHGSDDDNDSDSDLPSSLSLRELSKVILPPLGVSSFTDDNKVKHHKWIISPMNSKYRYSHTVVLIFFIFYFVLVKIFQKNKNPFLFSFTFPTILKILVNNLYQHDHSSIT